MIKFAVVARGKKGIS